MGDTLRYAERMDLLHMQPRSELASTGFVLANPGREYLVLQPEDTDDPFTVRLEPGVYVVEWFNIPRRETVSAEKLEVENDGKVSFKTPFSASGPVILYLRQ